MSIWQLPESDMDPAWIQSSWEKNPCVKIIDQNGVPNGNYRTGPVRGSFVNIFDRSKPIPPATTGKYGSDLLFPPAADLSVLKAAASETALAKWKDAGQKDAHGNDVGPALRTPFRQQREKAKHAGYMKTDGGIFLACNADQRQPYIVDARGVPLTEKDKARGGNWFLAVIRPFSYDKGVNKGVAFGLQGLIFIAADKALGGDGGGNPLADMHGAQIDTSATAAAINPAGLF